MDIIPACDETDVERLSSVRQFKNFVGTFKKGEFVPITFDHLDSVTCTPDGDEIVSHKIIVKSGDWLGYVFPARNCKYSSTKVLTTDYQDIIINEDGETVEQDKIVAVGADNAVISLKDDYTLRTGLDYALADNFLDPVD